jgi:AcrR family transcriptional regulator
MQVKVEIFAVAPPGGPEKSTDPMQETRTGRPRSEECHNAILQTAIDLVLEFGFRAVSIESIAAKSGVAKTTIYRRWPNKAAIVMDAFMLRFGSGTQFPPAKKVTESIRLQMRTMAKAFRSRDGALVKALLAEAQFDAELATAFRERWTLPRRRMALAVFQKAISQGELRSDIDLEATIDLLYAPMYYRLQMGTGSLSDAYIDEIFDQAMEGLLQRKDRIQKDGKR